MGSNPTVSAGDRSGAMIVNYSKIAGSEKAAHQSVSIDEESVGDVWREQVKVVAQRIRP